RRFAFDEEQGAEARSRDVVVEEGQPVGLRHEGAHRSRCRKRSRAHGGRDDDRAVYGDKGYASDVKKRAAEEAGVLWAVKEKAKPGRDLTKRQRARNR